MLNYAIFLSCLWTLPAFAKAPVKAGPKIDVPGSYQKALSYFNENRFDEAATLAAEVLTAYPDLPRFKVLLARAYLKLDRPQDAMKAFRAVKFSELETEVYFDYGLAFYRMRQWETALMAFKAVPAGHSSFDIAQYHGGIAALNLRRYGEAQSMLEAAKLLPDRLIQSRELQLKTVRDLRLREERELLRRQRAYDATIMVQQTRVYMAALRRERERPVDPPPTGESLAKAPKSIRSFPLQRPRRLLGLVGTLTQQSAEYLSLSRPVYPQASTVGLIGFLEGETENAEPLVVGGGIGGNATFRKANGSMVVTNTEESLFEEMLYDQSLPFQYLYGASGRVWAEAQGFSPLIRIGALLSLSGKIAATQDLQAVAGLGQVYLGRRTRDFSLIGRAGLSEFRKNPLNQSTRRAFNGELDWSYLADDFLGWEARVAGRQWVYELPKVNGPEWEMRVEGGSFLRLPMELELGARTTFNYASDYRFYELETIDELRFEEQRIDGGLYLNWQPLSYWGIECEGFRAMRFFSQLSDTSPEVRRNIEGKRPNLLTEFRIRTTLAYSF